MSKEKKNYSYPFKTKAQILAAQADFEVCKQDLITLFKLQTEDEQDTKTTRHKNRRGFMSSHAVNGTLLARKVIAKEELTEEDEAKIRSIVGRYGRQLAAHSRQQAMEANPELRAIAQTFSAA